MCEGTRDSEPQKAPIQIEALSLHSKDAADALVKDERRGIASGPPPPPQQLFQNRKRLIRQTWALVEQEWDVNITRVFYQRLFEKHPSTKAMFIEAPIELQAWKLYEILRVAVRFVDNIDVMLPSIKEMGIRHAQAYNVKRGHFDALTAVFIEVLNEFLDLYLQQTVGRSYVLWRMDVTAAWAWILTLIGSTMADAADSARIDTLGSATRSPSPSPTPERCEDMEK